MDTTIDGGVAVSTDAGIKLTIAKGVTLTVNGGITAGTRTLTIEGKGTLVVNGADQNTVGTTGDKGSDGRDGTYAQNCGGAGKTGGNGAGGGVGIEANLVVNGVTVIVTGGTGGKGGKGGDGGNGYGGGPGEERRPGGSGGTGGTGGAGGVGIKGSVTVNSGSITVTGGAGGDGGDGGAAGQYGDGSFLPENKPTAGVKGQDGSPGQAVSGTITGYEAAQESDDASTWTAISGTSSTKRYVKVAHLHSFTYSASGATITATCGKTGCDLTENKATLTIVVPTLTTYGQTGDGISAEATITDADNIRGDAPVVYKKGTDTLASAPTNAGTYTASITLGEATAAVGYTIAQKEVTVSGITANEKIYDGNTDATLETTAATFTGKLDGDTLTVTGTGTFDNANVGDGKTVTISNLALDGTSKDNYKLAAEGQQTTATAKITAKEVGLTWNNAELSYTGEAQKPTATATGVVDGDTCTVTVSGEQTNIGDNYTATAESLSNSNYKLPENKTTTFKIVKGSAVAATVTASNRTYDGTEKPLVTVDESTLVGGTMRYALGENTTTAPAENLYTTSIPAKTEAGTYYVWYRVKGDLNHHDSEPRCVTVNISIVNAPPAPTAAPTHVPKTGDGANLVLWIGLILLGFLGIIAFAGMAGRKHRNR